MLKIVRLESFISEAFRTSPPLLCAHSWVRFPRAKGECVFLTVTSACCGHGLCFLLKGQDLIAAEGLAGGGPESEGGLLEWKEKALFHCGEMDEEPNSPLPAQH